MSDDAAFLAAIQAHPDADSARLVYADWLDEHGRANQAEYLRIVHALAGEPDECPRQRVLVKRLRKVAASIDESWRDAAGQRFDVLMEGWLGGAMFAFLKAIRWLTGTRTLGAMEPNDESRTIALRRGVRREEAEAYVSEMDPQRFRKKRETKSPYRIVPATVLALPDEAK